MSRQVKAQRRDDDGQRLSEKGPGRRAVLLAACLLAAVLVVVVRCAWVSDDAYITFRVVDNLWNGYGLRWNVSERVCVYTNPLMMLLMAALYPVTQEFFYTAALFSIAVSAVTIAIVLRRMAPSLVAMVYVFGVLVTSKAFVDYATSGLEQCLSYLFVAVLYWLAFKKDPRRDRTFLLMALTAGLGTLNRMDNVLLFVPLLAVSWWQKRSWKRLLLLGVGFLPFVLWEGFSLIYYGWLLPNTAYAKLKTGLSLWFYARQGLLYYQNSLKLDPITLPAIFTALVACIWSRRALPVAAAAGVVAYLLYIIRVGGDFMSGRHFSAPLLCAVMLWCVVPLPGPAKMRKPLLALAAAAIIVTGLCHPLSPVLSGTGYSSFVSPQLQQYEPNNGICDERAFYYPPNGLLRAWHHQRMPAHVWREEGEQLRSTGSRVAVLGAVGMRAYYAGPQVHVVDYLALTDPLLARLPAPQDVELRIGHMERLIPAAYIESLRTGENRFKDPHMARMYEAIRRIHSGPIWSRQRWADMWAMHTGAYYDRIDKSPFLRALEDVPEIGDDGNAVRPP